MLYRQKPVTVEAEQFLATKASFDAIMTMALGRLNWAPGEIGSETFLIVTPDMEMTVRRGDYVIKGVTGEFYPCSATVFEASFEPADG